MYNVRIDKDKLDAMQKVLTQQVHLIAMETSEPRTVTEMCPNCDREVTMEWDVSVDGYKATCPHCGGCLMLCDECRHPNGGFFDKCDFDAKTDTCKHNPGGKRA